MAQSWRRFRLWPYSQYAVPGIFVSPSVSTWAKDQLWYWDCQVLFNKSNHFLTISCIIHKAHWWSRLNWARKVPSWKWETKMGDMGDIVVGSGPVVIFDILEPPAFNKYSTCCFFQALCICVFIYLRIRRVGNRRYSI